MAADLTDSFERMSHDELIGLVRELLGEVARLRADNERLCAGLSKLQVEHQAVKDELARLKGLPPRPPVKPSGMEKSMQAKGTDGEARKKDGRSTRRRGSLLDRLTISNTVVIKAVAPTGSRHKGYEDIVVQDLNLQATVTRYRRERWETPAGENIVAELAPSQRHGLVLQGRQLDLRRVTLAQDVGLVAQDDAQIADQQHYSGFVAGLRERSGVGVNENKVVPEQP